MKLRAEVLGVQTNGTELIVTTQFNEIAAAEWRDMQPLVLRISDIPRHRKAFHVGRALRITVEPL